MKKIRFSSVETLRVTSLQSVSLLLFLFTATLSFSQPPASYYAPAEGKSGNALRVAMHNIIKEPAVVTYDELWGSFYSTDMRPDTNMVWDMYSDQPGSTPAYYFAFGSDKCGNYGGEGDCYNREHSVPKSWFGTSSPPPAMYTDLFHLIPTDGYVNSLRGNLPFGKVIQATWTSTNGSKKGTSNIPGYSGKVFEPIDSFKGDFARIYFYMAVCYMDKNLGLETLSNFTGGDLKPWAQQLFLEWAAMDPVSQKEINRNNAVHQIQNNRNPFVDYPELAEMIFGNDTNTAFQTSIPYYFDKKAWNIYPNPVTSIINIQSANYQGDKLKIEIQNVAGKTLLTQQADNTNNVQIDMSEFPTGLYLVKLSSEQNIYTYKIVKQ